MSRPRAAILMYHRVSDLHVVPEEGDYALPAPLFEAQVRLLARRGRSVVSLDALTQGRYPDRTVSLTFDDGCETDATVAAPILRELGFSAAFFVNPTLVGHEARVSWHQLREMATQGFQIGSHGLDHTLFDDLPDEELERQIVESKRRLEEQLARPVEALSLPGGSGGPRALRLAREAGYRHVLGSRPAPVHGPAGTGILPRFAIRRGQGLDGFRAAVDLKPLFLLEQALRHGGARGARLLIGTSAYARLRLFWLRRSGRLRRA